MTNQRPRILAIDDTPANLQLLGAALVADFDLRVAISGSLGLALAEQFEPDLILLDVMMPEMDGYETCRRLKANPHLAHIPVVFLTALRDSDSEWKGLALGAADYILKPISVQIARQRIHNLIERERLRKEVESHRDRLEDLVQVRTHALQVAKEAAEAASRAKTTFLNNVSHELRTPLTLIMGMNDLAMRHANGEKQAYQLSVVKRESAHLLALINSVLDMTSLEANRLELASQDFVLQDVLDELSSRFGPNVSEKGVALALAPDPAVAHLPMLGDPLRLGQVLNCLVDNAIKFTASGSVSVGATLAEESTAGLMLRFEVRDTGIGISAADRRRIFDPFVQADGATTRRYSGTGLGLGLSRQLVRLMGGDLGVESEVGAGALFWFTARFARQGNAAGRS